MKTYCETCKEKIKCITEIFQYIQKGPDTIYFCKYDCYKKYLNDNNHITKN